MSNIQDLRPTACLLSPLKWQHVTWKKLSSRIYFFPVEFSNKLWLHYIEPCWCVLSAIVWQTSFPAWEVQNNFCRHPPHICHVWYDTTALPRDKTALAHLAFWFVYLVCFTWFTWRSVCICVCDVFGICCCFKWCFLSCPKWCPNIVHGGAKWLHLCYHVAKRYVNLIWSRGGY